MSPGQQSRWSIVCIVYTYLSRYLGRYSSSSGIDVDAYIGILSLLSALDDVEVYPVTGRLSA